VGRLTRCLLAIVLVSGAWLARTDAAAAFAGFGSLGAESSYGSEIVFRTELPGGAPERLELLLRTPGDDGAFVVPVSARGTSAAYVWDTSSDHLTPNTPVSYRWRAVEGDTVTLSDEATIRYVDDRPGLDWRSAQLGQATVHWYGDAEAQARRFGEVTALGVERAERLLGTRLAGPVDVFVYDSREDFFGALGPGAREWTGAAAYSELRTIFMWLGGGSAAYLERAMVHEVTHIVFFDATDNAFHSPARWFNEGIATWLETGEASAERANVELEANGGGLFAFEAITEQFPLGERGGRLSYAQGTSMVDLIIDRYGEESIARITAAYRDGASDAEALEAGTGLPADELYAAFFAEFGVEAPQPIVPDPILPSNVDRPDPGAVDPGGVASPEVRPTDGVATPGEEPAPGGSISNVLLLVGLGVAVLGAVSIAVVVTRRARRMPS
jgi:hypothetical protein